MFQQVLQELRATRAMWHVSILLGLIRYAYWWGDKNWKKTHKSSSCSHWMDSRVTSIINIRMLNVIYLLVVSLFVCSTLRWCAFIPYFLLWYLFKGGSRHKNWCMARVLPFLIRYFSNYYTLHRSDLAARAAPLDPRLLFIICKI